MQSDPHLLVNQLAIDDPHRIVKVIASDGRSGEQRELAYTNCKVIGNGSFGVVFQAKLLADSSKGNEEIAIKKVLQDKRFKVLLLIDLFPSFFQTPPLALVRVMLTAMILLHRTANYKL